MIEGQCFPCYDNAMFQYHGTVNHSAVKYIEDYKSEGLPNVSCVTCGRLVKYKQNTKTNKWMEVVVNG